MFYRYVNISANPWHNGTSSILVNAGSHSLNLHVHINLFIRTKFKETTTYLSTLSANSFFSAPSPEAVASVSCEVEACTVCSVIISS